MTGIIERTASCYNNILRGRKKYIAEHFFVLGDVVHNDTVESSDYRYHASKADIVFNATLGGVRCLCILAGVVAGGPLGGFLMNEAVSFAENGSTYLSKNGLPSFLKKKR
jgi:hypothetical protein